MGTEGNPEHPKTFPDVLKPLFDGYSGKRIPDLVHYLDHRDYLNQFTRIRSLIQLVDFPDTTCLSHEEKIPCDQCWLASTNTHLITSRAGKGWAEKPERETILTT